MGEVINIFRARDENPGPNGEWVHNYIEQRLDFEISEAVYNEIDQVVGQSWDATAPGSSFDTDDICAAIRGLRDEDILLNETQIHTVAHLMVDALLEGGYIA